MKRGWLVAIALMIACNNLEQLDQHSTTEKEATILDESVVKKDLAIKPKWKQVILIKGKGPKESEIFRIRGKEWKIAWKTQSDETSDEFILILYDKNNPENTEVIANTTGDSEDFVYLEGKGEYYLSINTKQSYEITIEELR